MINVKHGQYFVNLEKNLVEIFYDESKVQECGSIFGKTLKCIIKSLRTDLTIDVASFLKIRQECKSASSLKTIIVNATLAAQVPLSLKKEPCKPIDINFINVSKEHQKLVEDLLVMLTAQNFVRRLQDTPPNIGTPEYYANEYVKELSKHKSIKVKVLTIADAKKLGMNLYLSVNQASGTHRPGKIVVAEYMGDKSNKSKTAYVGKGITFDSGGYDLKISGFPKNMKYDMSGSAIVVGALSSIAELGIKTNISIVAPLTDNYIGGHGSTTDSIYKSMNGISVEISNTDAEGRLVLADAMTYAIRELKANKVLTIATLTGAIAIALGETYTGAWATCDCDWKELCSAAHSAKEKVWRLPLNDDYLALMKKNTFLADINNIANGRNAGSSRAANFLNVFAEEKPFMHLDIAATAYSETEGGHAVMLRTLVELSKTINNCKDKKDSKKECKI